MRSLAPRCSSVPVYEPSSEPELSPRVYTGWNVFRMGSLPAVLGIEIVRGGAVTLLSARHEWLFRTHLGRDHMDLLGVKFVLARGACDGPARFGYEVVQREAGVCVQENPNDVPRFELLSRYRRVANVEELVEGARKAPRGPVTVLADPDVELPPQGQTRGRAELLRHRPGHVKLEVTSDAARLLLVRKSWAEGWRATVAGEEVPIHPTAGVFFALPVPAGRHVVELEFSAPGFAGGLFLLGLWLVLAGYAIYREGPLR